jgi:DNA/RNA endonuclease YhcR with UshA esterase domain
MKSWIPLLMGVSFALTFATTAAFAQGRGYGTGTSTYDPKTEVAVKGTIEDVQQQTGRRGWSGTHLVLKTDAATFDVHVGPSAYIAQQKFTFAKGDVIEVVGSKVTIADEEAVLAREITKDGKTLVLRNAQGIPEWSRGPRRGN